MNITCWQRHHVPVQELPSLTSSWRGSWQCSRRLTWGRTTSVALCHNILWRCPGFLSTWLRSGSLSSLHALIVSSSGQTLTGKLLTKRHYIDRWLAKAHATVQSKYDTNSVWQVKVSLAAAIKNTHSPMTVLIAITSINRRKWSISTRVLDMRSCHAPFLWKCGVHTAWITPNVGHVYTAFLEF